MFQRQIFTGDDVDDDDDKIIFHEGRKGSNKTTKQENVIPQFRLPL